MKQITLLVTKAVSDQIGGGGMADEVIRFNGFPFLEKEDKEGDDDAFIEPSECHSSGLRTDDGLIR